MTRRWFLAFLLFLAIAGLVMLLLPTPIEEEAPEGSDLAPHAADADATAAISPTAESPPDRTSSPVLNQQAINAWHTGDILNAMTLFEQAIDAGPDNPEPHSNYGRLLTLMASYEKALPLLEHARDLRPDNAQAWLDLATLYERTQMLELSWAAQAEAAKIVGSESITRDEQGRFVVVGTTLW